MFEVNGGVSFGDDDIDGFENSATPVETVGEIKQTTVEDVLKNLGNSIAFDIAKNHTGICIWENSSVILDGFDIEYDYDKSDALADCKMRKWFRDKIKTYVEGKHYDVVQVEGIFAGENVDTFRKLVILNTVVGELLLDGVFTADRYYNLKKVEWFKDFKMLGRAGRGLNSKLETQEILKRLNFPFVLENIDKSKAEKEKMFFEDICDAVGMLCGVAVALNSDVNLKKSSSFGLSNIKQYYLWEYEEIYNTRDAILKEIEPTFITLNSKTVKMVEAELKNLLITNPDRVYAAVLKNEDYSLYVQSRGWELSPNEEGYLIFYRKDIRNYANITGVQIYR